MTHDAFKAIIKANNDIKKLDKRRKLTMTKDIVPGNMIGEAVDGHDMGLCVWNVAEKNWNGGDVQRLGIIVNSRLRQETYRSAARIYVYV